MADRTVAEIRAYMAQDMKLHDYLALVDADLPRLLDAGEDSHKALDWLWKAVLCGRKLTDREKHDLGSFIADTAWLTDEPATETPGEQVLRHIGETETWINGDLPKGAPATDGEEGGT